ncbi:hypothetical protein HDU92_000074 [Lobulomyces angularis]|nr:hypothetical protein HDU92_000074 [Lobulomyces angularis]
MKISFTKISILQIREEMMLKTNSSSLKNNEMVIGETTFEKNYFDKSKSEYGILVTCTRCNQSYSKTFQQTAGKEKAEEVDEAGFAVVHSSELCGKSQKRRLRFSLGFGEYKEGTFLENNLFVVFA